MDTSGEDFASDFQAVVLLLGEICWGHFKSSKILGNFPIALSPVFLVSSGNL